MIEVRNRDLIIPTSDEFVGVAGDNKIEARQFVITDPKLFSFDFKLDVQQGENKNIIDLDKTVETDKIILSWVVKKEHIPNNGILYAQLRAFSDNEEIWHSKKNYFNIGGRIGATDYFPSPLPSEFEEMEQRITQKHNEVIEAAEQVDEDKQTVADNLETVLEKAEEALQSAAAALQSEINAKTSEDNAKDYADEAERQADIAHNNILNGVAAHNESEESHPYVLSEMVRIESIARGKASAKVFDTTEEMNDWLSDSDNVETLKIGDNLYIRDINVPDYWWDGEQPQILEAQAINLSDYYTKVEVDARLPIVIEQSDYDELVDLGQVIASRIYYVVPDGALGDSDD